MPVRRDAGRRDIVAANTLGRALHNDAYASGGRPVNLARHAFLNWAASELFYPPKVKRSLQRWSLGGLCE
jgi:transcription regulator MmyB-like protein